jgi:hypothetical protein
MLVLSISLLVTALLTGCGSDNSLNLPPPPPNAGKPAQPKAGPTAGPESHPAPVPSDTAASPAPKPAPARPPRTPPAGLVEAAFGNTGRTAFVPESWKQQPPSSAMRLAQFKIAKQGADTEDGELTIFNMASGSLDSNITRWVSQFSGEKPLKSRTTVKTAAGEEATVLELQGDYAGSGMGMGKDDSTKKNFAMLGAIIPTNGTAWFFKLTGPKQTVEAAKAGFDKMIESMQ